MSQQILITGASGGLGGGVLDTLVKLLPAGRLVALGRKAEQMQRFADQSVEVRIADFDDAAATEKALTGIHSLYLVPTAAPNRLEQHQRVIETAERAGVKHLFYSSVIHHGETGHGAIISDHQATEAMIQGSGIPHTLIRNSIYLDVLPMLLGNAAETGYFAYPSAPMGVSMAARADMAEATAKIIATSDLHDRVHALSPDQPIHYADVAHAYGHLLGREIEHLDCTVAQHQAALVQGGTPEFLAPFLAAMARGLAEGVIREPNSALQELLGRDPVSAETFLRSLPRSVPA
ncbi:MAG: NmrA family NAD(P)-binding protein [Flavobacteriales bacterium]|nr:NmrA family NAD(P)-binding protein [Flavobacteriales bacterium]